ncbi:hypothetical protein, partial [Shewanella algae]
MRSAFKFCFTLLCSFLLFACGGGGSISDTGDGSTPPTGTTTVTLNISDPNISAENPATLTATVSGVVDQIIRLNATAPRLSAALRD